jgi:hypothetical protein
MSAALAISPLPEQFSLGSLAIAHGKILSKLKSLPLTFPFPS